MKYLENVPTSVPGTARGVYVKVESVSEVGGTFAMSTVNTEKK